jgi:hypothetical protein
VIWFPICSIVQHYLGKEKENDKEKARQSQINVTGERQIKRKKNMKHQRIIMSNTKSETKIIGENRNQSH